MTTEEYQKRAHEFAQYGDESYPYMALCEEVGEVHGKVAKFTRHNEGITPWKARKEFSNALKDQLDRFHQDIRKELGDVMWMVAEIATINGLTLEGIMDSNINKLRDRKERGKIDGAGDDR